VAPPICESGEIRARAEILTTDIATHIAQIGAAEVLLGDAAPGEGHRLSLQVRAMEGARATRYQVHLCEAATPRLIWQGYMDCAGDALFENSAQMDQLMIEAAAAGSSYFGQLPNDDALDDATLAFQMFAHFPFQSGPRLRRFEQWFAQRSDGISSRALQLAWRARLRLVSLLESGRSDRSALNDAQEYSRAALGMASDDPMVCAIAADVALHAEGRTAIACQLTRRSVAMRPHNPFIHAIHAQALSRADRLEEGHAAARRALRLAEGQPNQSWWHAICASTAIRLNRFSEARDHAELAHMMAPGFKPPLRFLSALRFHDGDDQGAVDMLGALKSLEPEFCLKRMADDSYPVASMRGTELLEVTRSGLI